MTSPVERISGPRRASTPGNFWKGRTTSLTKKPSTWGSVMKFRSVKGFPGGDLGGVTGERIACGFADEGDRPAGAGVDFQDIDNFITHGELDIKQPFHTHRHADALGIFTQDFDVIAC